MREEKPCLWFPLLYDALRCETPNAALHLHRGAVQRRCCPTPTALPAVRCKRLFGPPRRPASHPPAGPTRGPAPSPAPRWSNRPPPGPSPPLLRARHLSVPWRSCHLSPPDHFMPGEYPCLSRSPLAAALRCATPNAALHLHR